MSPVEGFDREHNWEKRYSDSRHEARKINEELK